MIIIVEGIDRVGKTTLCNKLKKELNIPIYRHVGERDFTKIDNNNETEKFLQILEICNLTNCSLILDRFNLSDYVYGIIERFYDIISAYKNFQIIDNILSQMDDVFLIYVLPTDIQESSRQHGKDLTIYENEFYSLFKQSKIKNKWRCTYNTLDEAILYIKSTIEREKRDAK